MTYSDNTNQERTIECEYCGHCYPESYMTTLDLPHESFDVCKEDCHNMQRREYSRLWAAAECLREQVLVYGRIVTDERIASMPHVVAAIESRASDTLLMNALISALRAVPLHMTQACAVDGSDVVLKIASESSAKTLRFASLTQAQWFCHLQFKPSPQRIFDAALVQPVNVDADIHLTIGEGHAVTLANLIPTLQSFDAVAHCGTANPDYIDHVRESFIEYLEALQTPQGREELRALRAKHAAPYSPVGHDVPF